MLVDRIAMPTRIGPMTMYSGALIVALSSILIAWIVTHA